MRIFLDNCASHWIVERLIPEWQALNVGVSTRPEGCDVQLSLIAVRTKTNLPTVLRLDGVYYDKATDYDKRNARISEAHSTADAVIYQSHFCKGMCERYLHSRKPGASGRVIYNGVRRDWTGPHKRSKYFNVVVSARWRRHKRLPEIERVFWEFCGTRQDVRLHVFGDTLEHKWDTHSFIMYYGHCTEERMALVFAKANVMLHLSKKDCCPNSVVEAIGAGVPVVATAACGGTVELCSMTKGCYVAEEEDTPDPCCHYTDEYNAMPERTEKDLITGLTAIEMNRRIGFGRVQQPEELTIDYMAREYLKVFREV